ncbi:MAG: hypothetical protein IPG55_10820 [Saprospiraceae bacterium]|nr:hypothetical protein [Candidatus Defluviibacterium haderslevense]
MDFNTIKRRIQELGFYGKFINRDYTYYSDDGVGTDPEKYPEFVEPVYKNVSEIILAIEAFEIEVLEHIEKIIKGKEKRKSEFLKAHFKSVYKSLDELAKPIYFEKNEFHYLFKLYNLTIPVTALSIIADGIPKELYSPIDEFINHNIAYDEQGIAYEWYTDNDIVNRFRAAVYIVVVRRFVDSVLLLFEDGPKSFQVINFNKNRKYLIELFPFSRIKKELLDDFLALFNGSQPIIPLIWDGKKGDLREIISTMEYNNLFIGLKAKTHWKLCLQCFKENETQKFVKSNLASGKPTRNKDNIRKIIGQMDNNYKN